MKEAVLELLGSFLGLAFCSLPLILTALLVLVFVFWKDRWRWLALLCLVPPVIEVTITGGRITADAAGGDYSHTLFPIELAVRAALWSPLSLLLLAVIWFLRLCLLPQRQVGLPEVRAESGGGGVKRRLRTLLLFLLLGAVVNVAVAWWCTSRIDLEFGDRWTIDSDTLRWLKDLEPRVSWYEEPRHKSDRRHMIPPYGRMYRSWGHRRIEYAGPPYSDYGFGVTRIVQVTCGWPLYALECEVVRGVDNENLWYTRAGIGPGIIDPARSVVLPFRPVWPGFAVNTAFHAVILWPLVLGLVALIRRLRRRGRARRGHCLRCGYDLRGKYDAGCPECGWGREEAKA
ncbi:MAG: hypothetical protein JSV91_14140 [Phycisphaerales bacterium]|nr:MAG: hypothetical protein JSV91_14140 [Phycisphaerales bacterium]